MYMENNDEECQFSLDELMSQIKGDYTPERKTVTHHLQERYGGRCDNFKDQTEYFCMPQAHRT